MSEAIFRPVAAESDVEEGAVVKVELQGQSILLCHTNGRIFAVANRCSHADEALECGRMRRGWIACPAHGARFNLETGEAMNPPATEAIVTYEVRVTGGTIEVLV